MTLTRPRKIALGAVAVVLALCGLGAVLIGGGESPTPVDVSSPAASASTQLAGKPTKTPALTTAQRNAVRAAQNYLNVSGFSRSGLIKQLAFEGYSTADAAAAVDSMHVDWNVQAERSAESYLSTMAFSRSGLIKQLKFDGYTTEQAAHGADSVGL